MKTATKLIVCLTVTCSLFSGYLYEYGMTVCADEIPAIENLRFREDISYRVSNDENEIWLFDYLEMIPQDASWDFTVISSDESILTSSFPYLRVGSSGTVSITVICSSDPAISTSHEFEVTDPVNPDEMISLSSQQLTVYMDHESSGIARISYVDGAARRKTLWTSSDTNVAFISEGTETAASITGISPGTVTVTAASIYNPALKIEYEVTVTDELPPDGTYNAGIKIPAGSGGAYTTLPDPLDLIVGEEKELLVDISGMAAFPTETAFLNGKVLRSELLEVTGAVCTGFSKSRTGQITYTWRVTITGTQAGRGWCYAGDTSFAVRTSKSKYDPRGFSRITGKTRFDTSISAAEAYRQEKGIDQFDSVILASGLNFADALSGSYLSSVKDAPILITADTFGYSQPYTKVNEYIRSHLKAGGTIYVLGGQAAVPQRILERLDEFNIVRISGMNRYETNIRILQEAGLNGKEILVCTGTEFADSLSASATGLPILLTDKTLTDSQKNYLSKLKDGQYCIIGGTGAVSENTARLLEPYGTVRRISGKTRHETSIMLAEEFFPDADHAVLAYSFNYPDGLCGGPLANAISSPVILTAEGEEEIVRSYFSKKGIESGYVTGGSGLISSQTLMIILSY